MMSRFLAFAKKRELGVYLAVAAVGVCFFVPFLGSLNLLDWDEANFAEAAREMVVSHNYLQVTINFEPFWEKPPLFFWLQVLAMKGFGITAFAARFVNALFGVLTLVTVYGIGRKLYDQLFGLVWGLAFLGSFLPQVYFKSGIIDPVFNYFIFIGLSLAAVGRCEPGRWRRWLWQALGGGAVGLAVLAKGPVALLVGALVLLAVEITERSRMRFSGVDLMIFFGAAALVASVFFGVETVAHGVKFAREFTQYQWRLFGTRDAGHGGPIYYHLIVILIGCFPASFFAIQSLARRRGDPAPHQLYQRMLITLFWVVLILFSIVKTKIVHYSSLAYFPVTYLAALQIHGLIRGTCRWPRGLSVALGAVAILIATALIIFPMILTHPHWLAPWLHDPFVSALLQNPVAWTGAEVGLGIGYLVAAGIALILIRRERFTAGISVLFGAGALCLQLFLALFAPRIEQYTQGGPIDFYKSYAGQRVYVRALFKSYADLFYAQKSPADPRESHDLNWLLTGPIDRPAFFVARIQQAPQFDQSPYQLTKLKSEYGFVYYRRDVPVASAPRN